MSSDPCSSQVLEDSVIKMRRYRVETGRSASFNVTVPPWAFFRTPEAKTLHSPLGPPSKSSAFVPLQYSTWYVAAYGLAHWIRTALRGFSAFKSTITHCGCWVSLSPVNLLVRYGLLFQYVRLRP